VSPRAGLDVVVKGNAGQNCSLQIADKSFENMTNSRYLGTAVTNQNCIHEEIRAD
jgi:hypothetical protein